MDKKQNSRDQEGDYMNDLIKVEVNEKQEQILSARDLHEFLGIGTQYTKWFNRMSEYGFVENVDFQAISQKRLTAQGNETTYTDHVIKIDMAKEISMLQRNEKGKQARRYFIELEKAWNTPEAVMARALKMADTKLVEYKDNILQLENKITKQKPKVVFADAVATSRSSILVGELAKIIKQNGTKNMGQNRLFAWLRENGFLIKRKGTDYNMPTQKSMELELFEIKETAITHSDGHVSVSKTPKVTGKGQIYFINKFKDVA